MSKEQIHFVLIDYSAYDRSLVRINPIIFKLTRELNLN